MNYYNKIKNTLINNEINKRVKDYSKNKSELQSYYNVGKLLIEAQDGETRAKYGNKLIKEYSIKLTKELGKGYSVTTLKYMQQFYIFCEKSHSVSDQLTWTHYRQLLSIDNINKINYYIQIIQNNTLSVKELKERIKSNEYERLPESTKEKLKHKEQIDLIETIKDPIFINNKTNIDISNIKEKTLQKIILDDLNNFLSQLGIGYSYIKNEYKIKVGNTYNYIDILLYNVIYHSYVVVELKVTPLKKEHIGQIQVYMNYIDYNLKTINDNKTIGLIVVKENDEYIIKYSSDKRIKVASFELI